MSEDRGSGDYAVGFGRPPKEHRFKKGVSGNPRGRPRAKPARQADITALLEAPVKVKAGGRAKTMVPFEVTTRQLAKKALEGDVRAILKFIDLCEQYGLLAPPQPEDGGSVVFAPPGVNFQEWFYRVTEEIPDDEL